VDRTSTSYLLWNLVFLGGGALWAALVFPPLLRKQKLPPRPEPWTRDDTLVYTTTITVLCTASTLGVLIWRPGSNGAWLVVTLLAVTQFGFTLIGSALILLASGITVWWAHYQQAHSPSAAAES
jgi:hypothetical protein